MNIFNRPAAQIWIYPEGTDFEYAKFSFVAFETVHRFALFSDSLQLQMAVSPNTVPV